MLPGMGGGEWSQPEHLEAWVLKAHLEKKREPKGRARLGLEWDKGNGRLGRAGGWAGESDSGLRSSL